MSDSEALVAVWRMVRIDKGHIPLSSKAATAKPLQMPPTKPRSSNAGLLIEYRIDTSSILALKKWSDP